MSSNLVRVKSWDEFKRLAAEFKPSSIVYNIEQSGLSSAKELTSLRLIMPCARAYYVFLDFPKGDELRETHIPLRKDRKGNRYLEEADVRDFLKKQFKREDITICSYWTI
ncbi:MAG: hypothetical protein QW840_04780, partial [Candidatus Bathyarchaeia archaeon]